MATIYITEYSDVLNARGLIPVGMEPAVAEQVRTITGASAQSNAFNAATKFIRVHTDSVCSIKIGLNPTAVITEKRMAADSTEYFGVPSGYKLAGIVNT